jgi:putative tricarboxylic transport membrane protein
MKLNDAVLGLVFGLLGLLVLWHVQSFPPIHGQQVGPAVFPRLIAIAMIVCSLILVVNGVRKRAGGRWVAPAEWWSSRPHLVAFIVAVAMPAFYVLAAEKLGFFIVSIVSLVALFLALKVRPKVAIITAVIATALIWYAFYKLLRVPLPWGVLQGHAF